MNYELTKELKDAGFRLYVTVVKDHPAIKIDGEHYLPPDLSELIEAVVQHERSFLLGISTKQGRGFSEWDAQSYDSKTREIAKGSTPEIAVARLWLALHPKDV